MARKKMSDDNLKILELPKRTPKILFSDDYLEIARRAQELAILAAKTEILAQQAKKAEKFVDSLLDDFYAAYKLRETQKEIFLQEFKKILG